MIEKGHWVAIALRRGVSGSYCYVGQVQDVDDRGIHITLIDWLIGTPQGWDFWASWDNIDGIEFATPQHDVDSFGKYAGDFQTRCNEQHQPSD